MVHVSKRTKNAGFSLVELIVGIAVFTGLIISVYSAYTSIFNVIYASRAKLDAVNLINEQFEIVRNMPYSQVGILNGLPAGLLSHTQTIIRDSNPFTVTTYVRNVDDPFDGTLGGTPNDTSPADHKLVEMDVDCSTCKNFKPIVVTTTVSPKGLETASTNGALFIKVFDANGNPIQDANVHIVNNTINPPIIIDDVTDIGGMLEVVDAPPGVNAYQITVSKSGYSTEQTYPTSTYPNPVKPNATVALQQITSISFSIDKVSTFGVITETTTCTQVPNFQFSLRGNKMVGTNPITYKYNTNQVTNIAANIDLLNMEWDNYTLTGTDSSYDIVGFNPIIPVNIQPNSVNAVSLIVAPKNPKTLLVTVLDGVTNLPLSGVDVTISKVGFASTTHTTGQGFVNQTDWSGGGGEATSTDLTKYFSSDGNIDTTLNPGDIALKNLFGTYVSSGVLTSSSFDTGGPSMFQKLQWLPGNQPTQVGTPNVRMQIATNNDGGTWNFTGPDGTAGTYYTTGNQNISATANTRYLRYKVYLDTASTTFTPDISDISFTYTSSCTPPGQVYYSGLSSGTYSMHLSKSGYTDQDISVPVSSPWQSLTITMMP